MVPLLRSNLNEKFVCLVNQTEKISQFRFPSTMLFQLYKEKGVIDVKLEIF